MKDPRGPWYLLTGLALGLLFGLLFAWFVLPARYSDAAPRHLDPESKAAYRSLVASAYAGDLDLRRAQARLALLGDADPAQALLDQAAELSVEAGQTPEAQALTQLAAALASSPSP